jgi:hypothetical protein
MHAAKCVRNVFLTFPCIPQRSSPHSVWLPRPLRSFLQQSPNRLHLPETQQERRGLQPRQRRRVARSGKGARKRRRRRRRKRRRRRRKRRRRSCAFVAKSFKSRFARSSFWPNIVDNICLLCIMFDSIYILSNMSLRVQTNFEEDEDVICSSR